MCHLTAHRWVQRSKAVLPSSPAMSTRSKRRLSLWFVICLLNLLVVCETNVCLNSHSCVTLFMWDSLIYVWLKLWWIYVRPYLYETWLIAMHVWKVLEHIIVDNQNCSLCEVIVRISELLTPYQNFWLSYRSSGFVQKSELLTLFQNFWCSLGGADFARKSKLLTPCQNFWFSRAILLCVNLFA
jgi:hypothetical protein